MKINLWAKKGIVTMSVVPDTKEGTAPTLTVEINNPQILYDGENKITIVETK